MKYEDSPKDSFTNEFLKMCQIIASEVWEGKQKTVGEDSKEATVLEEMIDAIPDGICIISHDGKIISVNAAFERLTGYTRDELKGESPLKIHPERERGLICAGLSECRENGSVGGFETFFLRKNRREIPIRLEFDTSFKHAY